MCCDVQLLYIVNALLKRESNVCLGKNTPCFFFKKSKELPGASPSINMHMLCIFHWETHPLHISLLYLRFAVYPTSVACPLSWLCRFVLDRKGLGHPTLPSHDHHPGSSPPKCFTHVYRFSISNVVLCKCDLWVWRGFDRCGCLNESLFSLRNFELASFWRLFLSAIKLNSFF